MAAPVETRRVQDGLRSGEGLVELPILGSARLGEGTSRPFDTPVAAFEVRLSRREKPRHRHD